MSDSQLDMIESLWRLYQQKRSQAPDLSVTVFASSYPEVERQIVKLFPMLNDLKEFAANPIPYPKEIGEYKVVRQIGIGGMGVVYEAENPNLQHQVAIKIVGPSLINGRNTRQLEKEARLAATLHHSNIVPVYDFGEFEENYFYTMKYIDGPNLSEILHLDRAELCDEMSTAEQHIVACADKLACNWELQIDLIRQVADAIRYAHGRGVLHRDVKPANLLLDDTFKVWITDFGLAKLRADDQRLTAKSKVMGTPRYMAPEQIRGEADERSDIFGLGLCFYEMALLRSDSKSGRRPIWKGGLQPPSHFNVLVPSPVESLIMKAVSLDPNDRHQSADEFIAELDRIKQELVVSEDSFVEKVESTRSPIRAIVSVFFAIILMSAIAYATLRSQFSFPENSPAKEPITQSINTVESVTTYRQISAVEGKGIITDLNEELLGFPPVGSVLNGPDAHHFRIDGQNHIVAASSLDFDVARDADLDNVYEVSIGNEILNQKCELSIELLDRNEAPSFNARIFTGGDDTIAIQHSKTRYPTQLEIDDDRSRLFDDLFVSISGGADRDHFVVTPSGTVAFSGMVDINRPSDIDKDNSYELELKVEDVCTANYVRLERNGDSFQLLFHRITDGLILSSRDGPRELSFSTDIIDIATQDGREFFHIHRDEIGTAALYRTYLDADLSDAKTQLLNSDCGIPQNAIGFSYLQRTTFAFLTLDNRNRVVMHRGKLNSRNTFEIAQLKEQIDLPNNVDCFSWLDGNRFQFVKPHGSSDGRFYFAFVAGDRLAKMPLSHNIDFHNRTIGMAAWVDKDEQSLATVRTVKFEVID